MTARPAPARRTWLPFWRTYSCAVALVRYQSPGLLGTACERRGEDNADGARPARSAQECRQHEPDGAEEQEEQAREQKSSQTGQPGQGGRDRGTRAVIPGDQRRRLPGEPAERQPDEVADRGGGGGVRPQPGGR